jgi:galactonate dehydratase
MQVTVTGLEIFRVHVNERGDWVIPRLQTSAGVTGIGDASHHAKNTDPRVKLQEYFEALKGRSVFDVEWFRQQMQPDILKVGSSAACAFSGLEQALYDIQGQLLGVPAYQLFGGKLHATLRNYANINRSANPRTPAGFAEMAAKAIAAGMDAIKLAPFDGMPLKGSAPEIEAHTQLGIHAIAAVREAIGDADLLVDAHSNFDLQRGLDLARRLEPLRLYWLEEICPDLADLATLNQTVPMPTAGGESLYGLQENHAYIAANAVDTLMPDVKYCGGMLELKKIAALAEAAGMPAAPHGPASPVGNISAAHVCAGMPNFQILEYAYGEVPWRAELIEPPEPLGPGGLLSVPDRPGLGIKLNEKVAREHAAE